MTGGGEALFAVLGRLRDAARGRVPRDPARERADWRVVDAFVRRSRDALGLEGDDVAQDALMAIVRHVGEMEARDEAGAIAWVTRIVRNKKIDAARGRLREPRALEAEGDEGSLVERLEGEDGRPIDDRALTMLIEVVEEAITAKVDGLPLPAIDRQLRRVQARATLHRVLGAGAGELREVLALESGVTDDRLHKWVERGRPLLVAVLEGLAWDQQDEVRALFHALRDAVLARRADAGRPRPARRKRGLR